MSDKRGLIRLDVRDFLSIAPLKEKTSSVEATTRNITFLGICFCALQEWKKGQSLLIDYFIPGESDSIKLKVVIIWSEFVSHEEGYFCGGEIYDMEDQNQEKFIRYYFRQLKQRFHE